MHISHIHIICTHLYSAQNRIFSTKKFVQLSIGIGIGIGTAVADSIGYWAPARYRSNPTHKGKYLQYLQIIPSLPNTFGATGIWTRDLLHHSRGQIFRIGTVRYAEGLWRMRRHRPVIAHCTDSENFPSRVTTNRLLAPPPQRGVCR